MAKLERAIHVTLQKRGGKTITAQAKTDVTENMKMQNQVPEKKVDLTIGKLSAHIPVPRKAGLLFSSISQLTDSSFFSSHNFFTNNLQWKGGCHIFLWQEKPRLFFHALIACTHKWYRNCIQFCTSRLFGIGNVPHVTSHPKSRGAEAPALKL
jgi:hypothetical protein